jgi:hypothetical protein
MDIDLYSQTQNRVSGTIVKASDVLKKIDQIKDEKFVPQSQDYALLRDQREQITKEIEHFQNKTGSILGDMMLVLINKFNQITELSEATALALSIKTELAKEYDVIEQEKIQARKLYQKLISLGADEEYTFLQTLLKIQEGKMRLDHGTVKAIEDKISEIEEEAVEKASTILLAGLEELGYEVSGIEETLFVDGGEFYFRKEDGPQAWDPHYYVRGKVNPKNKKVIFLMGYEGQSMHSKEQDYRVEEQFYSEFGVLQKSLEQNNVQVMIEELIMPGEGGLIDVDINDVLNKKQASIKKFSTTKQKAQSIH